jgi:hypothetical protein
MRVPEQDPEARIVDVLCIACTAPFIAATIVRDEGIGPGTTIAMIIAALGVLGLIVSWHRRVRLPCARARQGAKGGATASVRERYVPPDVDVDSASRSR